LEKVTEFEDKFLKFLEVNHQEDVLDILKSGEINDNVIKIIEETARLIIKQL